MRSVLVPSEAFFFYVLVRHTLRQAGIDDREMADYLAPMLLDFGRHDRAWRVDWHDDQQHRYLADILIDLEASEGERRFKVMVHLGNYALWLAGLFPDYIAARHLRKGGPDVTYYDALGRRGFGLARSCAGRPLWSGRGAPYGFRPVSLVAGRLERNERPSVVSRSRPWTAIYGIWEYTEPRTLRERLPRAAGLRYQCPPSGAELSACISSGCHWTASSQRSSGPFHRFDQAIVSPSARHRSAPDP